MFATQKYRQSLNKPVPVGGPGYDAWLRYDALPDELRNSHYKYSQIVLLTNNNTSPVFTAAKELQNGIRGILGQDVDLSHTLDPSHIAGKLVVGTVQSFDSAGGDIKNIPSLKEDGFWLDIQSNSVYILGQNERSTLYGAFKYLSRLAQANFDPISEARNPSAPIRWINQWDNLNGTIERGYGGLSIFFDKGNVLEDLSRVHQYARILASVGLNGIVVNNVNAGYQLLNETNLKGLGRIADIFRLYGLRIGIAVFFDSPKALGGLPTSDPLDPGVIQWWKDITTEVYKHVPDLIGYTIKANSEGQPGPLTYGRTLADGANLFARALKPHGDGLVMYRAFVYNHHLDESNMKNDRANAAVEFFKPLDGQFDDNVVVQIKWGPIDFQVREPPSPLFANLRHTNAVIEFQVAQEYYGQQSHLFYMPPLWKTILDFDLRIDGKQSLIRDVVSGERHGWKYGGYVSVTNVGNDPTWLGSHLAMANLYAFGRYAWDPTSDPVEVVQSWTKLTFGLNPTVLDIITQLSMESWPTYENYSGNLGIQTLCDILGIHFGPGPGSQDGNGWGQWTRADAHAIGMDRTVTTGTGYAGQYPPEVAAKFEHIDTTPDELLLWFHHVPYTHKLKSGKTVIQHFYDAHYEGSAHAQTFPKRWSKLRGLIDDARFEHVAFRLEFQAGHTLVWRDGINEFYRAKCGIQDTAERPKGRRVGTYPWRIEVEEMDLEGYKVVDVTPTEMASRGKAVVTTSNDQPGTARTKLDNTASGTYDIAVNYYNHLGGHSRYELFLNDKSIAKWTGDLEDKLGHDFSEKMDGHSATRITFPGVKVEKGDVLKIVGHPDGSELAPLDYVSVLPEGEVD